jgi:hypothetical protein
MLLSLGLSSGKTWGNPHCTDEASRTCGESGVVTDGHWSLITNHHHALATGSWVLPLDGKSSGRGLSRFLLRHVG